MTDHVLKALEEADATNKKVQKSLAVIILQFVRHIDANLPDPRMRKECAFPGHTGDFLEHLATRLEDIGKKNP